MKREACSGDDIQNNVGATRGETLEGLQLFYRLTHEVGVAPLVKDLDL